MFMGYASILLLCGLAWRWSFSLPPPLVSRGACSFVSSLSCAYQLWWCRSDWSAWHNQVRQHPGHPGAAGHPRSGARCALLAVPLVPQQGRGEADRVRSHPRPPLLCLLSGWLWPCFVSVLMCLLVFLLVHGLGMTFSCLGVCLPVCLWIALGVCRTAGHHGGH